MPSFRHGFRAFDVGSDTIGAKKGSILYLNDGTGKFFVPNAATLGRTLYNVDSMSAAGFMYAGPWPTPESSLKIPCVTSMPLAANGVTSTTTATWI